MLIPNLDTLWHHDDLIVDEVILGNGVPFDFLIGYVLMLGTG